MASTNTSSLRKLRSCVCGEGRGHTQQDNRIWLNRYFDDAEEKDVWLDQMKKQFNEAKIAATPKEKDRLGAAYVPTAPPVPAQSSENGSAEKKW